MTETPKEPVFKLTAYVPERVRRALLLESVHRGLTIGELIAEMTASKTRYLDMADEAISGGETAPKARPGPKPRKGKPAPPPRD
jgi:hypothetical protein